MNYTLGLMRYRKRYVSTPERAMKILEKFRNLPKEVMLVIHLKPDLSSDSAQKAAVGTSEACCFETKDIYRPAILQEASGIIMAHSHPWQRKVRPSAEDVKLTRAMAVVAKAAKMPLLDHIIFGKEGYYSFRANGKVLLPASPTYEIGKSSGGRVKGTKSVVLRMLAKVSVTHIIR